MDRFRRLLEMEQKYREEENAALVALLHSTGKSKLSQLRRAGLAATGLKIEGRRSMASGRLVLDLVDVFASAAKPASTTKPATTTASSASLAAFRTGDPVRVVSFNGSEGVDSCDGTVERVNGGNVSVSLDRGGDGIVEDWGWEASEAKARQGAPLLSLLKVVSDAKGFARMFWVLKEVESARGDSLAAFLLKTLRLDTTLVLPETEAVTRETPNRERPLSLGLFNGNLNAEQRLAVQMALDAPQVALIHGPPGTGKTHTLVELIQQHLKAHRGASSYQRRVLVCGPSNLSVDNVAERVLRADPSIKLLRLGHPARVAESLQGATLDALIGRSEQGQLLADVRREIEEHVDRLFGSGGKKHVAWAERKAMLAELRLLRQERRERERALAGDLLGDAEVIACTLATAGGNRLRGFQFGLAVVDEAAQALLPEALTVALLASKIVLAGDHWQLPPTVTSPEAAAKGLEETLFAHLCVNRANDGFAVMLCEQYRMNEAIMGWSNGRFYGGRLRAHSSVASGRLRASADGAAFDESLLDPLVFYDTAGFDVWEEEERVLEESGERERVQMQVRIQLDMEQSKRNRGEAAIVLKHVDMLISRGVAAEDIGVISPYSAQVALLREGLDPLLMGAVQVSTIDGFQGREKDVIVVSTVRSNSEGSVGFLAELRRLNVALTRARRQLVLIGDSATLERDPELSGLVKHLHEHATLQFPDM
jgi:DNA polymerase alpha-associated DNA helicase A